ncbi:MAG: glucodextranase DOMON-like domain-containing protein [Thermoprotei archaeon]|nr:glucodextranase DOMON-like domain-containing protein [Thermoprotei archaeon]
MRKTFILVLSAIILLSLLSSTTATAQKTLISIADAEEDDRGPGYYGYPANPVFKPGVFDIVKFEVIDLGEAIRFAVSFKDLGGNPWGGPNGFSLQNIQIYVRTTQAGLPARTDTLGLNVAFSSSFAWHFAIIIVPGWEEKMAPEGQRSGILLYGSSIVQDGVLTISVSGNTIMASVNKKALVDVENIASWTITVMVASYDGFGPNRVRTVGPTGGEWVLNGTKYATPEQRARIAKAIAAGMEPRVLDLTVYSPEFKAGIDAATQYKWLDSYNPDLKLPAMVPPIVVAPQVVTTTVFKTETKTETKTELRTQELTVTTEVPTVSWPISIVLLIVGLIVGVIVARFLIK